MCNSPNRIDLSDHSLISTSLDNVKAHLRITDDEEDTLITEYIKAATKSAEKWLGMNFLFGRNVGYYQYCSFCECFEIKNRKLCVIEKIEYLTDGEYVELASSEYNVFKNTYNTIIELENSLTVDDCKPDQVKITYILGFTEEICVESVVKAGSELTITTSTEHGLSVDDKVCLKSEQDEYTGMFVVSESASSTEFKIVVNAGDPEPSGDFKLFKESVPPNVQVAIKQMVAKMYENAGDCADECGEIPCCARALLKGHKKKIIRSPKEKCGC